jgi:hypothetical protein
LNRIPASSVRFKPLSYYYWGARVLFGALLLVPDERPLWIISCVMFGVLVGSQVPAGFWRAGGSVVVEPQGIRHRSTLIGWERIAGASGQLVGGGPASVVCTVLLHVREGCGFDLRTLGVFRGSSAQEFESLVLRYATARRTATKPENVITFWRLSAIDAVAWGLILAVLYHFGAPAHQIEHLAIYFGAGLPIQYLAWTRALRRLTA